MNILVTGGAGYIGSHTVVALVEAGFNPIIVDDFSNSELAVLDGLAVILGRRPVCYQTDCNDRDKLSEIMKKEKIEAVIHFAAFKAVGESMEKPLSYYRNNLLSMIALLEAMAENEVKILIFSSSCTVYGIPDELPVTEATPMKPASSVYGHTKQVGEDLLRFTVSAGSGLKVIALRYFNPIGAHPSALIGELPLGIPNNLVPFATQTAAGLREVLTVYGNDYDTPDGSCIRDYIHVMDLAEAHVAALQRLLGLNMPMHFDTFNLGTGNGNSVLEIVQVFEQSTGVPLPHKIGPRRPGDIPKIYADVAKSTNVLGWRAKRSLAESLQDAWRWQKALMSKQDASKKPY
jgi:UDP-glucose 4-epimerase